jgi:alpha-tubulin suppressor-like RCC1 family protein
LFLWGNNAEGEIGDNTTTNRSSPVQVYGNEKTWEKIDGGSEHFGAIKNDGSIYFWGKNAEGQVGDESTTPRSIPIQIGLGGKWIYLSLGDNFSSALKSSITATVTPSFTASVTPSPTPSSSVTPTPSISASASPTPSISNSPTITPSVTPSPTPSPSPSMSPTPTPTGFNSGSSLFVWGEGTGNNIGDGLRINRSSITQTYYKTNDWALVECGDIFNGAIKYNGTIWTWGSNVSGDCGLGYTSLDVSIPTQIGTDTNWLMLSINYGGQAIKTNNTLWSWGINSNGESGLGDTVVRSSPAQIIGNWSYVSRGNSAVGAIRTNGTLWLWGANESGQLGNNTSVNSSSPVQEITLSIWKKVSVGLYNSAAIKTDATLWMWGIDGLNGDNTSIARSSPVQIYGGGSWIDVAVGWRTTIAIKSNGTLWAWGANSYGEMGIGTRFNNYVSSPIQIGSQSYWSQILQGCYKLSGAINNSGHLFVWGNNDTGQLDNSNTNNISSPTQVLAPNNSRWITGGGSAFNIAGIVEFGPTPSPSPSGATPSPTPSPSPSESPTPTPSPSLPIYVLFYAWV